MKNLVKNQLAIFIGVFLVSFLATSLPTLASEGEGVENKGVWMLATMVGVALWVGGVVYYTTRDYRISACMGGVTFFSLIIIIMFVAPVVVTYEEEGGEYIYILIWKLIVEAGVAFSIAGIANMVWIKDFDTAGYLAVFLFGAFRLFDSIAGAIRFMDFMAS